ncbi:B12-binding domain-containing radical SAM protein [Geothrix sp. 21YS21S-2]|uniref:B12-binding domain-containing radical SAM protein n=1 Tax=Geothrix sp. 21YS21S-2 TaxID=3068893 RepID=UPI0027BA4531|nr:B12-binding domain-containing radical SAM protein [Geothrix sp. 21YS21S-2]
MDLVLVAIHLEASARAVPLGPAMLASVLRRSFGAEVAVRVLDLYLDQTPEACADRILEDAPRWVGFSMYLWNRDLTMAVARVLRARRPDLVIFAGGSEATADPEGVLGDPSMDLVLPGEGEDLIVEAVKHLLRGQDPRALQATLRPAPVADLAALPSPYLDGTLDPSAYPGQLWELSRGCPFKCDFCFESRGGTGTRRVPMERVEAELRLFEAKGVSQIFVLDPTFNFDRARAKEVLRLIAAEAPAIHFFFEIRTEFIDRELARLFASIRCTLQIGLQSAHDAVLRNINRRIDPDEFESRVLLLHRAGATYGFDLIYGLPGDDLEGFKASLDYALGLAPNHLDIFCLAVLPGTRLFETAASFGLEHQAANPYLVTASPGFPPEDLAQAARIARACDTFYNDGKAVPWFAIVQGALGLEPSELFRRFADHPGSGDVIGLQRDFITAQFEALGLEAQGSVAADLITWFGLSARLADAEARREPLAGPCSGFFAHDPALLLDQLAAGITELEDLSFVLPADPGERILHFRDGEACLAEPR